MDAALIGPGRLTPARLTPIDKDGVMNHAPVGPAVRPWPRLSSMATDYGRAASAPPRLRNLLRRRARTGTGRRIWGGLGRQGCCGQSGRPTAADGVGVGVH